MVTRLSTRNCPLATELATPCQRPRCSLRAHIFGFTGIAAGAAKIAKVLFFIALAIMLVFLVLGLMAGAAIV